MLVDHAFSPRRSAPMECLAPVMRSAVSRRSEQSPGVAQDASCCSRSSTRLPSRSLHTELFVKFSRDIEHPVRDRGRTQMEPEVRFAVLSRAPEFPIAVPRPQFGDYHRDSGTGLLITERISFGANGIERQYHKCLDYEMPEPYEHYRALLTAVARLAGTHQSGHLPASLTQHLPVDMQAATVGEPAPLNARQSATAPGPACRVRRNASISRPR